jgi:UDP-N-acetylglucosamine 1-carboxyvinyltransferase
VVNNVIYEHLESFIAKLEEMGVQMIVRDDSIEVLKSENLRAVNIKTVPYPGFATDLQQPITPLLLMTTGRGKVIDTIYEKGLTMQRNWHVWGQILLRITVKLFIMRRMTCMAQK